MSSEVQDLFSALDVFGRTTDKAELEKANDWLQRFQHAPDAWTMCNVILRSADSPPAAKVFAAQTLRSKVIYDLNQVSTENLLPLRDTLVEVLRLYQNGPKNIVIQLCLALAGLALQVPAWRNAVQSMIDAFGGNPSTVPILLQFLTVLPDELNTNTKIPVTDQEYRERSADLLTANAKQVLDLLSMYIQASGITTAVQNQIFNCLRNWVIAGEITATDLAASPLFDFSFEALASEELFDAAVDVVCDLIHETQEIDENMPVIEGIVPKVIALRPALTAAYDDPEKVRGYARIFSEAGETYRLLILQHTEIFFPIVEAISECSAYPDLDIVPITFPFWARLAQSIGKKSSIAPAFYDAYKSLMAAVIRHLHFPPDASPMLGEELDNFRSFRHVMGDTLKDCCHVLGTGPCLMAAYDMITTALAQGANVTWQDIEAPLFAMRSMGAQVELNDVTAVPKIMDLLPRLPQHPRVRYAALLIISRYTDWISQHPDYIPPALQYVSSGFEDTDSEVIGAASHALKYLCDDCKRHLVTFLPQLHTFLVSAGPKLTRDDQTSVYEAISFVISAMPMEQAAQSLRTFSLDILAAVHAITTQATVPSKQDLQRVEDGLANLEVMLYTVGPFGEELPETCQNTCQEAWAIFDAFIAKYGSDYEVAEHTTRVLRHGLTLFGAYALPVAANVVAKMTTAFEATGLASYLWIGGKVLAQSGNEENPQLRAAFKALYERSTNKMAALLQEKTPSSLPDVLEDYIQMLLRLLTYGPDIFFESAVFPVAFRVVMTALTLVQSDPVFYSLDLIRSIVTHDCLMPNVTTPPPKFPIYAAAIRQVIDKEGFDLAGLLISGLVGDFPEDAPSSIISIFRVLAELWSQPLLSWVGPILMRLPSTSVPDMAKAQFLSDLAAAINAGQYDKVKYAIVGLHRASRKTRDRRRVEPLDR